MATATALTPKKRTEAIEFAWQIGRLNYRRRRTQLALKAARDASRKIGRKFYAETTRRLGKSSEMLSDYTEECLQQPNRKCAFFAPVKDGLLDYIQPIIYKTYQDCPPARVPKFDKQRFLLQFPYNSQIIFRGSNNQQHRVRRGQEFHRAGIDEARDVDNLSELIDSVVFPALFDSDGYLDIYSTPADTRSHPLYTYRQQLQASGALFRCTIWDANRLDPLVYTKERIEEWRKETLNNPNGDSIWKREYECEWVVDKSRQAVPEWRHDYVIEPQRDPYYQFYKHYIGIDWGYRDFTAVTFSSLLYRQARLQFEGELTFSGTDVRSDRIAEAIDAHATKLWGKDWTTNRQISDSADPILINELNVHPKMSFVPVVKERGHEKGKGLEAMLNQFRVLVNAGKIAVSPQCTFLLHGLENAVWDEKREKLDQDVFARHFDHLMSAVYTTRLVDWNDNPIPRDFMVDGVRIIDIDFNKRPDISIDAAAIEEAFQYTQRRF